MSIKTDGELLQAIENNIVKPSEYSTKHPTNAILRFWKSGYGFMEVPRSEVKKALDSIRLKLMFDQLDYHEMFLMKILVDLACIMPESVGLKKLRCLVQRYDPAVTEPPLQFINLDEFHVYETPTDKDGGREFARILEMKCQHLGYNMKFYSNTSEDGYDLAITVD